MSRLSKAQRVPLLCYVTDRSGLFPAGTPETSRHLDTRKILIEKIEAAVVAGVDWIQIREKDLSGKECSSLTRQAVRLAASHSSRAVTETRVSARTEAGREQVSSRILVNDRLDVALATEAGGVHLGEKGLLSLEKTRRLVKSLGREEGFLIGISCHSLDSARAAESGGAGYLFFGPVFATPSKAAYGAPQGLKRLAEVCRAVALPVLAIGGITLENATDCLSVGASGIAAIRLFQDASDMASVGRQFRGLSD